MSINLDSLTVKGESYRKRQSLAMMIILKTQGWQQLIQHFLG